MIRLEFEAIGTLWKIDFETSKDSEKIEKHIRETIERFDKNYSRFRSDSLVHAISKKAGIYTLPPDAEPMMKLYRELYEITHGKMTPLIGDVLSATGYDAE